MRLELLTWLSVITVLVAGYLMRMKRSTREARVERHKEVLIATWAAARGWTYVTAVPERIRKNWRGFCPYRSGMPVIERHLLQVQFGAETYSVFEMRWGYRLAPVLYTAVVAELPGGPPSSLRIPCSVRGRRFGLFARPGPAEEVGTTLEQNVRRLLSALPAADCEVVGRLSLLLVPGSLLSTNIEQVLEVSCGITDLLLSQPLEVAGTS